MSIHVILQGLRLHQPFMKQVSAWQKLPAKNARFDSVSVTLPANLLQAVSQTGANQFYTHQAVAIDAIFNGENVVVATATASGKSLCYTVPVMARLADNPKATALYLFPTKALAQDQLAAAKRFVVAGGLPVQVNTYDGDTPSSQRTKVRKAGGVVISNPDMLHAGILPNHPRWRDFLRNLQFVVIDEIHTYRGVFGSHVANVLRRLRRLCEFYGGNPQFICCSATIANPKQHAETLTSVPFTLVGEAQNGAPQGEKQFILYNPPIIDEELGMRQSLTLATRDAAFTFLQGGEQTVVFARARQTVELLLTYLQDDMVLEGKPADSVRGYRGGYLPLERREIERGLRSGDVQGVVATNALELGIDIGGLSAVVMAGYPGSIAGTWQQAGRAGRGTEQAAVVLVAGNGALDQYICRHPRYLFGQSPEHALINPDNPRILLNHLQCATFELPYPQNERYGDNSVDNLLDGLVDAGILHNSRNQYHYIGQDVPAHTFSLRTSGDDTVVIHDTSTAHPNVIGEIDLESVPYMAYEGAIYMHQARTFQVTHLDWEGRLAQVQPVEVDYYTRATVGSRLTRLAPESEAVENGVLHAVGEVTLVSQATGYRKIRRYTHETLGYGQIDLPEMVLDSMGYWLVIGEEMTEGLINAGILLAPNDYGPNWKSQRQAALDRDGHQCRTCGATGMLHVHHIRPFREYVAEWGRQEGRRTGGEEDRENTSRNTPHLSPNLQSPSSNLPPAFYATANHLNNLATLCPSCHRRAEAGQQTRSALGGLGYVLGNLAPLFLMCDPGDIGVNAESQNPLTGAPTVVVYEKMPAGIGFSQTLYEKRHELLSSALEMITDCRCQHGCPACVGPPADIGPDTKQITRQLLKKLSAQAKKVYL